MKQPTFATWTEVERATFLRGVVRGDTRPVSFLALKVVSARTWQRWRHLARGGNERYQEFVSDLNWRVKTAWCTEATGR